MICLIAGNFKEAQIWARGQMLENDEWFFPTDDLDLLRRRNFHVIVVGTAGQNTPQVYFERVLQLAWQRGRMR